LGHRHGFGKVHCSVIFGFDNRTILAMSEQRAIIRLPITHLPDFPITRLTFGSFSIIFRFGAEAACLTVA
jgi:hypothetical protein